MLLSRHVFALVLAAQAGFGQGNAELSGAVRDPLGLPLPEAAVEVRSLATGLAYNAESDARGRYHFLALPPGDYEIQVSKPDFQARRRDLPLRTGDRRILDFTLPIGEISLALEVKADAPLLQAGRGTTGFVVEREKVANLPLDGRNFIPLLALLPGVSLPPGSTLPRINGSRPRVSEYLYDGVSVLQPEPGQVAFFPVIDAISEFRVETNSYSAEYGRSNGGVILVSQRGGTNEFHGTMFEFLRNEALNARNLFATPGPKPLFRRNQYGFVFGGPIRANRSFFFVDWQGTRLATGAILKSTVPIAQERAGLFTVPVFDPSSTRQTASGRQRDPFPAGRIPIARFDPAARSALARYPLPVVPEKANNYTRTAVDSAAQERFDGRLDRYFGGAHRVFGRYSYMRDHSVPATPLPDGSGNIAAGIIGDTLVRAGGLAVEHTWTRGGGIINQARFGYTRRGFARSALRTGQPSSAISHVPNLPPSAFPDVFPIFDIAGYQQIGPPANGNARFTTSVTHLLDTYSQVKGRHTLKVGGDVRLERLDVLQPPHPAGKFQFTPVLSGGLSPEGAPLLNTGHSVASFLLGQVQNFSIDVQRDWLQPRAAIAEFFVQDDWRATPRLSLNMGLRHTLNLPSTEANDRGAVFNLATQQLDFLGRNGFPRTARNLEWTNFGPRLGLAYRVTDSFLIRSGYGLTWIEQAGITTPFTTPLFPFIRTAGQRSLDNIFPAFSLSDGPAVEAGTPGPDSGLGQGVFAVQRDQKSGYAQQWNFTLQKTSGENWSLEAGYAGSKLTNLGVPDVNLNQLAASQLALGAGLTAQVANPFYGEIPLSSSLGGPLIARQQLLRPFPRFTTVALYRNNVGNSTYHSLQARLEKRFSGGLSFSASYTFSRLIDDAGAVFDAAILTGPPAVFQAADSFNRRLEKDVSTGDIRHAAAGGFVYELPFERGLLQRGWRLAGIARLQSGSPVAVTQATNYNAFAGFGIQRPNRLADPRLSAAERTPARYFNTAAFALASPFTLGNSSRNPVKGPGYGALDLMLARHFRLSERLGIEFRAEVFNLTNTPPLGNPNGILGGPAFGTIGAALDPRVFELAIKVAF